MLALKDNWITAFVKLIRSPNLLILASTQYLAASCLIPDHNLFNTLADSWLFCLVLSTVLIAASGYIINDYYDIKIDLINKSDKVIIGKTLSRRQALIFHAALNAAGILLGFLAGWKIGIITILSAFSLWLYSNHLKRLPFSGNFLVAFLTALSIQLIGIYYHQSHYAIGLYSLFAFIISLIREIIKDMQDMKGDQTFGCKTLPILLGIRKTKRIIYLIQVFFVATLGFVIFNFPLKISYYFIFTLVPSLVVFNLFLTRADTSKDFKFLSSWCKIVMLIGMISMLFI